MTTLQHDHPSYATVMGDHLGIPGGIMVGGHEYTSFSYPAKGYLVELVIVNY